MNHRVLLTHNNELHSPRPKFLLKIVNLFRAFQKEKIFFVVINVTPISEDILSLNLAESKNVPDPNTCFFGNPESF